MNILQIVRDLEACPDAIAWLEGNKYLSAEQLYSQCPRGDWLLWFFSRIGVEQKLLVLAACDCADLAKHLLPDDAPKDTTDIIRAYHQNEIQLKELHVAFDNIWKAISYSRTTCAHAVYAMHAADYAMRAVGAVCVGARASAAASMACYAIEASVWATTGTDTPYIDSARQCANIARQHIPFETAMQALLLAMQTEVDK